MRSRLVTVAMWSLTLAMFAGFAITATLFTRDALTGVWQIKAIPSLLIFPLLGVRMVYHLREKWWL